MHKIRTIPLTKKYASFLITAVLVLAFTWATLTEKSEVNLRGERGRFVLSINGKKIGEYTVPAYQRARLILMLGQTRQMGEGFFQGWNNLTITDLEGSHKVAVTSHTPSALRHWIPLKGTWRINPFGNFSLAPPPEADGSFHVVDMFGPGQPYGELLFPDVNFRDFEMNLDWYNASSTAICLEFDQKSFLTAYVQVYPAPTLIWELNKTSVSSINAEDLTDAVEKKLTLWPSKSKIVKDMIGKLCGSCLAAIILILFFNVFPWCFRAYFKMMAAWV